MAGFASLRRGRGRMADAVMQDSQPSVVGRRLPRRAAALCAGLLACLPMPLLGLGLGEITLASALHEPLRAAVELTLDEQERAGLAVRLATPAEYERLGLPYAAPLRGLQLRLAPEAARIELVTDLPVTEPVLDIVLEVGSPGGGWRQRAYVLLFDPRP